MLERRDQARMLRAKPALDQIYRLPEVLFRQVVALLRVVKDRQVRESRAQPRVIQTPVRPLDLEGSEEQGLGIGVPSLTGVESCQIVEAVRNANMIGAQSLFLNLKRQLQEFLGL